jgi:hypothetical protein
MKEARTRSEHIDPALSAGAGRSILNLRRRAWTDLVDFASQPVWNHWNLRWGGFGGNYLASDGWRYGLQTFERFDPGSGHHPQHLNSSAFSQ